MAKAASGSAQGMRQKVWTARPASAIIERQAHAADWAASARRAALAVRAERRRFCLAKKGMTQAAASRTAIPRKLGSGSRYPSSEKAEISTT